LELIANFFEEIGAISFGHCFDERLAEDLQPANDVAGQCRWPWNEFNVQNGESCADQ